MGRAAKSYLQLIDKNAPGHRTKAEIKIRKKGEESVLSKVKIKEAAETKKNPIAHKEFKRIVTLLKNIQKDDDLYSGPINRYCMLKAECIEFIEKRERFYENLNRLTIEYESQQYEEQMSMTEYHNLQCKMQNQILSLDKQVQNKRKMMLDIEKENLMTIASAIRSIPKTPVKEDDKDDSLFD